MDLNPIGFGYLYTTYCKTYPSSLSGPPTFSVALSILDLEYWLDQRLISIDAVYKNKTDTQFCFTLELSNGEDLVNMKMGYLTVDPAFT